MTKGFCTLAVGDKAYYQLATNLLLSYRLHTKNPLSFAIICDHENEYTKLFDKVVILSHSSCSYMDKIENVKIVHWQNRNTQKALYRTEVKRMELFMKNSKEPTLYAHLMGHIL